MEGFGVSLRSVRATIVFNARHVTSTTGLYMVREIEDVHVALLNDAPQHVLEQAAALGGEAVEGAGRPPTPLGRSRVRLHCLPLHHKTPVSGDPTLRDLQHMLQAQPAAHA